MPYRTVSDTYTWHWCHNCSQWPSHDFDEREDKPPTWNGQVLCPECATRDGCSDCQHSVTLSVGLASDSWLRSQSDHDGPKSTG
jgi:hypothetical protein